MSDIVERLRSQSILDVWHPMMLEAAAEILRLRSENEKLRAALAFYAKPENWHINGLLDANSANYTGGPASKILETEND